jgi:hypothetical protein
MRRQVGWFAPGNRPSSPPPGGACVVKRGSPWNQYGQDRQAWERPRRTHPAVGCRAFEELLQREQERGCKPGRARHVWAARGRST